jgi:uncharacterized membrane protein YhaH (DUF805 family)
MGIVECIRTNFLDVLSKHYFDFNGRASRPQFWYFILVSFLTGSCVYLCGALQDASIGQLLFQLYNVLVLLPTLSIGARRLHDGGFSGWWQVLFLIPVAGYIAVIILYCLPTKETSRY